MSLLDGVVPAGVPGTGPTARRADAMNRRVRRHLPVWDDGWLCWCGSTFEFDLLAMKHTEWVRLASGADEEVPEAVW